MAHSEKKIHLTKLDEAINEAKSQNLVPLIIDPSGRVGTLHIYTHTFMVKSILVILVLFFIICIHAAYIHLCVYLTMYSFILYV